MNLINPISAHMPLYSLDQENRGALMDNYTSRSIHSASFHRLPGLFGQIVRDLAASGGVAAEVVFFTLIAIISLLTKGSADVLYPNGRRLSVGGNVWLSAPLTSGKDTVLRILMRPLEQDWAMRISANRAKQSGGFLIDDDVPFDAMTKILHKHPIVGYFTGEPGQFEKMLKHASKWYRILEGEFVRRAQHSGKPIEPCLTVFLTDEPDVREAKILQTASQKIGARFLNHFFYARLDAPHLEGPLHRACLSAETTLLYEAQVQVCLDALLMQNMHGGIFQRPPLIFSREAVQHLDHVDPEVRSHCGPGGRWASVAKYAAGHIERIARFSGSLHVFAHGTQGEISLETLKCADAIGKWCLDCVAQTISEPPKLTQAEIDAAALEEGLIHLCFSSACETRFRKSDIRAFAVGWGVAPTRFDRALAVLGKQGKVRTYSHGNRRCVEILCVPEFSRIPPYLRTVPGSFA